MHVTRLGSILTLVFAASAFAANEVPQPNTRAEFQPSGRVSGTVAYRQRIALPPDAVLVVQLQDTSRQDVAAEVLGEQRLESPGQVPIAFEIDYDPSLIDPRHSYGVAARILRGDRLLFINDAAYPVITRGNPDRVEMLLRQVSR
jgi:putative lipoprotein